MLSTPVQPFGKGHIGDGKCILSSIVSGLELSAIYTYIDGLPLALTGSTCTAFAGTCMPSYNLNFTGPLMPYGKWGSGATSQNLATRQYINPKALLTTTSSNFPTQNGGHLIGNVARAAPLGLRGPSNFNIESTLSSTFNIVKGGRAKFVFGVSAFNALHHVWFGGPSATRRAEVPSIPQWVILALEP